VKAELEQKRNIERTTVSVQASRVCSLPDEEESTDLSATLFQPGIYYVYSECIQS
jgi:hypothetical protein